MRYELASGVHYSGGRAAQTLLHGPYAGQQIVGLRLELTGERDTQIVVAPTAFSLRQGIAQSGIGLPHAVPELGQPRSPISQAVRIQPDLVHVVTPSGVFRPFPRSRNRRSKPVTNADNGTDVVERSTTPSSAT